MGHGAHLRRERARQLLMAMLTASLLTRLRPVFAHFAHVALGVGHINLTVIERLSDASVPGGVAGVIGSWPKCVMAAQFSGNPGGGVDLVALNACPYAANVPAWPLTAAEVTRVITYRGLASDSPASPWANRSSIGNLCSPPWTNGTLEPTLSSELPAALEAISLTFVSSRKMAPCSPPPPPPPLRPRSTPPSRLVPCCSEQEHARRLLLASSSVPFPRSPSATLRANHGPRATLGLMCTFHTLATI